MTRRSIPGDGGPGMDHDFLEELPLAYRLALTYAPASSREATLDLLALDARLAGIVRGKGEPIIAQMKLAWWRDRLGSDPADWPKGEPLLARLREGRLAPAKLLPLVDGWECLLAETLDAARMDEFAAGRASGWHALAQSAGQGGAGTLQPGREFALADLAIHLGDAEEASQVRERALGEPWKRPGLGRPLRTLAVLHALSRRALRKGHGELLAGPGAAALAMRVGIAGA